MPWSAQRTPFGMRRVAVDTPRGPIVCLRNGPAAVTASPCPAMMVNGLAETKERWSPALVHLARQGYRAYSYDHLGQFESGGADDPAHYTVPALAADLAALLDELSPEHPVHVVGGCFGGFVADALAARVPHRVRSLTLLGSGPSLASSSAPRMHEQVAEAVAGGGAAAVFEEVRDQALRAGISWRSIERVREGYLATRPGFLTGFSRSVAEYHRSRHSRPPVLVCYGSADEMWSAADQRAMAARIDAAIEVIDGAGHSPTVTHPSATADVLTRFWAAAEGRCEPAPAATDPREELDTFSA